MFALFVNALNYISIHPGPIQLTIGSMPSGELQIEWSGNLFGPNKPKGFATVGKIKITEKYNKYGFPIPYEWETERSFHVTINGKILPYEEANKWREPARKYLHKSEIGGIDPDNVLLPDGVEHTRTGYGNYFLDILFWGCVFTFFLALTMIILSFVKNLLYLTGMTRLENGMCPVCMYDLRELPENRCPECGETWQPLENA